MTFNAHIIEKVNVFIIVYIVPVTHEKVVEIKQVCMTVKYAYLIIAMRKLPCTS